MVKIEKKEAGFGVVEAVIVLLVVAIVSLAGFVVYRNHNKTSSNNTATNTVKSNTSTQSSTTASSQKYVSIAAWGVRVPYGGNDTLSASDQTCSENGDSKGSTVNLGCQVVVTSKDLANAVGSCQSAKATGVVGYFYKISANDNYNETNGSGYEAIAQWAAQNPGQYTKIGSYYYAFAPIGAAWGGSGADSIKTSTNALADTTPSGCGTWIATYNVVEPAVKVLAAKFAIAQ